MRPSRRRSAWRRCSASCARSSPTRARRPRPRGARQHARRVQRPDRPAAHDAELSRSPAGAPDTARGDPEVRPNFDLQPALRPRARSPGCATSARAPPTTTPTATTPASRRSSSPSSSRHPGAATLRPQPAEPAARRPAEAATSSAARAAPRRPPRTVRRRRADAATRPSATRARCRRAHEARPRHRSRPRRPSSRSPSSPRARATTSETPTGPRDLHERVLPHDGRGRQGRRRQGRQGRVARGHRRTTGGVRLRHRRPGFQDFRSDAECAIRPQSLIGDKFVECTLTQPRPAGQQPAAAAHDPGG